MEKNLSEIRFEESNLFSEQYEILYTVRDIMMFGENSIYARFGEKPDSIEKIIALINAEVSKLSD